MSFEKKRRLKRPAHPVTPQTAVGTVVVSRAGRDRGRAYVIGSVETDAGGKCFAYLFDGTRVKAKKPKKKSAAHVTSAEAIAESLTDEAVSAFLAAYAESGNEGI